MYSVYEELPPALSIPTLIFTTIIITLSTLYAFTWIKFQFDYQKLITAKDQHNLSAPNLPAVIPWLGSVPSFLVRKPNKFWKDLFNWYSRSAGACSMILGGKRSVVVFDPQAIVSIFKDRKISRESFDEQVVVNALGVSQHNANLMFKHGPGLNPIHPDEMAINLEYLMKADRVTEMTTQFIRAFTDEIQDEFDQPTEVNINEWLRITMFPAATEALMGRDIVDQIPDLWKMYYQFEQDILGMFFGLPSFMLKKQIANRDRLFAAIKKWQESSQEKCNGIVADPAEVSWEPIYGSRHNRARQILYNKPKFDNNTRAALDAGNMFGFSANTIPGAGWMLMRILDTKGSQNSLYDRILAEVFEARNTDGSINVPALMNQPVIMSCLHEVLRMDVDTLVSRTVPEDMKIPLGRGSRSLLCKAGSVLMVPSWPSHNNPEIWQTDGRPPPNIFYPYRFLSHDSGTEKKTPTFSTSPYPGSYFPFGGGKAMCPGRLFARQEILTTIAIMLTRYDFEVLHYVDGKDQKTLSFPGLKDTFPGSVMMVASGDVRVRVKRRD